MEAWQALVWKKNSSETVLDDSQESGVCNVWLDLANLPDHLTQHPPVHDPLETCLDTVEYQPQPSDLRFHLDNLPCKPLLLPHHITCVKVNSHT